MPSFDIVSKADLQEVKNALDQSEREIGTRYDFRNSNCSLELKEDKLLVLLADDKVKLGAMQDILRQKLAKRGVSLKCVVFKDPSAASGNSLRQEVEVKQGLSDEELKRLNRTIKDLGFKVSSQIQGTELRVTGKKKDDLQSVIAALRTKIQDIDLQFVNFRD